MTNIMRKIFIDISITFLSFMFFFYGYRLIHYYQEEHNPMPKNYSILEYLMSEENLNKNKLIKEDEKYYFKGDAENNYLIFNGLLYRILYIDDSNVYLLADEPITSLKYGSTGDYNESNVKDWLENVYLNNLDRVYLRSDNITLLDRKLIEKLSLNKYYNCENDFWILDNNQALIMTTDGELKATNNYELFLGVRPFIELNGFVEYVAGDGSKDNPYLIEKRDIKFTNGLMIGEYVSYQKATFRVVGKNDFGLKVVRTEPLGVKYHFSNNNVNFNIKNVGDLGSYLNQNYLLQLEKDDLVSTDWFIGQYTNDYKETMNKSINCYIGLLSVGDYFINSVPNSYLLTSNNDNIYIISNNKYLMKSNTTQLLDIYPAFVLKTTLKISQGTGKIDDPYVVGD